MRQRLAKYRPDLEAPVPKGCTDAIADPRRTMLGSRQFQRFAKDIQRSPAAFKMILSSVPIQQLYGFPLDRWEGYEPARQQFLRFLQQKVTNVVFLSTDAHGVSQTRYSSAPWSRAVRSALAYREAVAGPVASLSYSGALGSAFAGRGFTTDLFKPPPPAGLGMSCAQPSVYSYADTQVTPITLSITLKNDRGEPVTDLVTGTPCPPLVIER